jgi:tetratricopeptide (TPR) repeat protein
MTSAPLPPRLAAAISELGERGFLTILHGGSGRLQGALAGELGDKELVIVDAELASLHLDGVIRAVAAPWMGGPGQRVEDAASGDDAVGAEAPARTGLRTITALWTGSNPEPLLPGDDSSALARRAELVSRWLRHVADLAPRVVWIDDASSMDEGSIRILRATLLRGPSPGLGLVLQGADAGLADARHPLSTLVEALRAAQNDDRAPAAALLELDVRDGDVGETGPSLPSRGSAVELLDLLRAAPIPLPVDVVGSEALRVFRDRAERGAWQDLASILEAGLARTDGRWLLVRPGPRGEGSDAPVARADLRAILRACRELDGIPPEDLALVLAHLADQEGGVNATPAMLEGVRALVARGEFFGARALLERADRLGQGDDALAARILRLSGQPSATSGRAADAGGATPLIERGLARATAGQQEAALQDLGAATEAARAEHPAVAGHAAWLAGKLALDAGDAVSAAQTLADAARLLESAELPRESARAFATRAACMARAGAPDRALKELRLAMDRALTDEDPHPAVLDVRILVGVVFRDAGHRDKARQALALAVDKARSCGALDREVEARLLLAKFHLEGMPAAGIARGEGLRDTREAAEGALAAARALGRPELEADVEAIFGELAWRAEDWPQAIRSLEVQEHLWRAAGRHARAIDTTLRRGRLAGRSGDWEAALGVAGVALQAASRRRLGEQSGQAQMLRAEALENIGRRDEALAAWSEAHRIFRGLGPTGAPQAEAAEQRGRQLVAASRS